MDRNFINQQTKDNYNLIADHFSQKRSIDKGWFSWILPYVKNNQKIIDLGCGNGRLYGYLRQNYQKVNYTGIDFCEKLIEIAQKNYSQARFELADISKHSTYKNFKNVDIIFSFRTIHHLPDKHQEFFNNCFKTLKKNGLLILEVWNLWQKRFWLDHIKQLSLKTLYIPYSAGKITVNRFHYCFTKNELVKMAEKSGFKVLDSGIKNHGQNIYLVAKKN